MGLMAWVTRRWKGRVIPPAIVVRTPVLDEPVWWAAKQLEGVVSRVNRVTFEFKSGPPVFRAKSKKTVPFRYTTAARMEDVYYDDTLHAWIVGQGPIPKNLPNTVIVRPEPMFVKLQ